MAVIRDLGPSATQSVTYEAFGLDEDFSEIITNITPDKTPFLSALSEDDDAVEPSFSWPTEELRPPQMNAHLEKEDYKTSPVGSTRALSNVVQIFHNTGWVSDMQRKTKKIYKQQDEFDRQKAKAFREHARDIEYALVNGDVSLPGAATVPALTGGIPFFLKSESLSCTLTVASGVISTGDKNHELETGSFVYFTAGTMPTGLSANTIYYVRVDATNPKTSFTIFNSMKGAVENIVSLQVKPTTAGTSLVLEKQNVVDLGGSADYTVANVNKVLEMCHHRGGMPNKLWMSPANKTRFSELVTNLATTNRKPGDKKGNIVADTLETDYGIVTACPHIWYPDMHIHAMDEEYFELKWFQRTHEVKDLAKKGNYSEFVIEGSIGLKGTQPLASGAILNIKR